MSIFNLITFKTFFACQGIDIMLSLALLPINFCYLNMVETLLFRYDSVIDKL